MEKYVKKRRNKRRRKHVRASYNIELLISPKTKAKLEEFKYGL